jgi:phosphoribosylformylglycinamidine synthase PurS subunit
MWEVLVEVRLHPEIRDPEGVTVKRAANSLGFGSIKKVSVGKALRLEIDADSAEEAQSIAQDFCQSLLVNPVLNFAEISVLGASTELEDPELKKR